MASPSPTDGPNGLLDYSVVHTDRALNPLSIPFKQVMKDISATLKRVYRAQSAAIVPGSEIFSMEAVARQFGTERRCLVVRTGDASYRWSQMLDQGRIPAERNVRKAARQDESDPKGAFVLPAIEDIVETIRDQQPDIVFAPHVDSSSGLMLPDEYMRQIAEAIHQENGLFILDSTASGAAWVDMLEIGVDVLIASPQGGWSSTPCCGMVMLSRLAREIIDETRSTSYACDLGRWLSIMEGFESDEPHNEAATLPTDGLRQLRDNMREIEAHGVDELREKQIALGTQAHDILAEHGFKSIAAREYQAPTVVVSYADQPRLVDTFAEAGLQVSDSVALMCDEGESFRSVRLGLFGLDKLLDTQATLSSLQTALSRVSASGAPAPGE
ncbi:alanine--glyoxylate aminotransferase family protein [Halomonas almeriensis]|uniref:alanine--glyoxylate aminotransferase family protein n=1 Tax=Halomonas almeriensis TaxID=308163 RepID=UPI0025B498C7|nr:alanine--glyoxylate aminotransferase family protein [Halomonas almeriensis]MDN3552214.1 alanine--glyoxylate aminotransferase family protein [Halomonas almeriensis]